MNAPRFISSPRVWLTAGLLSVSALAHAGDVFWSVKVNAPLDGVGRIGTAVSNYPRGESRGYYYAQPVIVQQPVVVQQPVMYRHRPVIYAPPAPVYVPQPVVYRPWGWGHRHHGWQERRSFERGYERGYRDGGWDDDRGGDRHHGRGEWHR